MPNVRVLEIARMDNRAGIETYLINMFRHIDKKVVQIDFLRTNREEGPFDEEIRKAGGNIYYVPSISKNPMQILSHIRKVKEFFSREKYDVVHLHGNTAISLIDAKYARLSGIQHVVGHSHNNYVKNFRQRITHRFLARYIQSFITDRFACSDEAWIWMFGNTEKYPRVISKNGIDTYRFRFDLKKREIIRSELGVSNQTVVGSVGRLTEQKNYVFLVKAFYEFHKMNPNSVLLFVGDGEKRTDIIKTASNLGIQDKIVITGFVDNPENYLYGMDIFALPSLWEGLGICLIEAQASGLPCIVSKAIVREAQIIDDLIYVVDDENNEKSWAREMEKINLNKDRVQFNSFVKQAGYDIADSALALQQFYIRCLGR